MSRFTPFLMKFFTVATLCFASHMAVASIVISGTRVIYPSDAREVTVKLNNMGSGPVLIQSWIDKGDADAKPETINAPFVLTPPINRVDQGKGQTLRLSYTGAALPMNKETVFYLNVLEIPAKVKAKADDNYLQMAFRTRIKLFYRPAGLTGVANDAVKQLSWSATATGLKASNPTPYYVNLVTVRVDGKSSEGKMISPGGSEVFSVPASSGSKVSIESVNDYGAIDKSDALAK